MRAADRASRHRHPASRSAGYRATALLTVAAVTLVGCGHYQASLAPPSEAAGQARPEGEPHFVLPEGMALEPSAEVTLPRAVRTERLVRDEPQLDDPDGWVQLRFDVDETGQAGNIRVVRASDSRLVRAAETLLADWEFRPATVDGSAVGFQDMEVVLGFADRISPGEAGRGVAMGAGVVVLLPVMLAASLLTGSGGSFRWK
jgi:TonB family protein